MRSTCCVSSSRSPNRTEVLFFMDRPDWLLTVLDHLNQAAASATTPEQIAQAIHEALLLAEAEKYATDESRFIFGISGASSEDIAEIWRRLTPFERSVVVIKNA